MQNELNHIGFICDGNATWAKQNNLPEKEGYIAGINAIIDTINNLTKYDVSYATFYVFSTENWGRPKDWRDNFFAVVRDILENVFVQKLEQSNAKIKFIGDTQKFDSEMLSIMNDIETKTKNNTGMLAYIAASYGGRDEIVRAVNKIILSGQEVTEASISQNIDTNLAPDVDLIIRTKNKARLSNFMLWQASYSEFLFIEELWPDFGEKQLDYAIKEFHKRTRTFGLK